MNRAVRASSLRMRWWGIDSSRAADLVMHGPVPNRDTAAMKLLALCLAAIVTISGCSSSDQTASTEVTASTLASTTTTVTEPPTSTTADESDDATTETVAEVEVDVEACETSVWSAGISPAGVDPWSSYSGDGQTANCVIIDQTGEDWVVGLTFRDEPWTNDEMALRYDPDWYRIILATELNSNDGVWFEEHPESCQTNNGQQVCVLASPRSEAADTLLVCQGRIFNIGPYTADSAESVRPTIEDYRRIQAEVFPKVCPTYAPPT